MNYIIENLNEKDKETLKDYCESEIPEACVVLGKKIFKTDINRANELYEKACDLGNGKGCSQLGCSYRNGCGVRKDINKANKLYEKACDLGDGAICSNLGDNYKNGNGVSKDL
ncbi:sel1 repeat family protein, partial [bacterium]|nr:sel1 repeat family protein [bacterium]